MPAAVALTLLLTSNLRVPAGHERPGGSLHTAELGAGRRPDRRAGPGPGLSPETSDPAAVPGHPGKRNRAVRSPAGAAGSQWFTAGVRPEARKTQCLGSRNGLIWSCRYKCWNALTLVSLFACSGNTGTMGDADTLFQVSFVTGT